MVSSTYKFNTSCSRCSEIWFIYNRKNKGPRIFPCGIQYLIKCVEDFSLCRLTTLDLSDLHVFLFSS